ncbi:minichromosome maintenance protein MCM [Candidatus Aenigmatarchaeota archaeon]
MDFVETLEEFLREKYETQLLKAVKENNGFLAVDFSDLDRYDIVIADQLLERPSEVLESFNEAATNIVNEKINIRVHDLPERREIRIRNLRAEHLNRLWSIDATVKSASEIKPQIYEVIFECPSCGTQLRMKQDSNLLQKPEVCECGRRGDFKQLEKKLFDIRWLNTIEPFEITTGEQPGEITTFLKEDLTTPKMQKKTDPGTRLKIVGILKEIPKRIKGRLSTRLDMYIEANHVEPSETEYEELVITEEDKKKIVELASDPNVYEKLVASLAPGIFGFSEIKESILMQIFGGIKHQQPDGTRIRGNIHILITGDPGVGKSQILKVVSNLVPRGKYVSGKGVTGAGLTATVRKDEALGTWLLEAGALILANKGMISIDEFDKMNRDDQIAMHEAMSMETVSIAKASIVATLPAETAVLAGANPKLGRFEPILSVAEQIKIPETLLSRFDLKFALRDVPDKTKDEQLAEHIITSRTKPRLIEPVIETRFLRKYIAYARQIKQIELTKEASESLKNFYVDMRNRYSGEEVPTIAITLRQYEALIRLAEASAKIRLDTKVRAADAERAMKLMKFSLSQLGVDYETGRIDIDRLESGVTASKRRKIGIIIEIIDELGKDQKGGEVSVEDVMAEAESRGIENIEDTIERLKREGTIFEPRAGFLKKI